MRPIPDRLLRHSVTWEARLSVDDHGLPTYGAAVTIDRCMDQRGGGISGSTFGGRANVTIDGEVIYPRGKLVIGGAVGLTPLDRVTLPDGLVARILSVSKPTGPATTAHHVTVVYG